jgi:hypothetical protein
MRRRLLEVSTGLVQLRVTPTERARVEKLMRRMKLPTMAEVLRSALTLLWETSESERLAKKAEKESK